MFDNMTWVTWHESHDMGHMTTRCIWHQKFRTDHENSLSRFLCALNYQTALKPFYSPHPHPPPPPRLTATHRHWRSVVVAVVMMVVVEVMVEVSRVFSGLSDRSIWRQSHRLLSSGGARLLTEWEGSNLSCHGQSSQRNVWFIRELCNS